MQIGIPREVKTLEGRVGLVPAAVAELVKQGHTLWVEQGAGLNSGYRDEEYQAAGASIVPTASELYGVSTLIIKVKEPQPKEFDLLRSDHLLFCFLHLAAEPSLMQALLEIGLTAVAFETVAEGRQLPLLAPMSDIAGRIAAQNGAQLLQRPSGGKGLLLGGLPAAERGRVVVLGGGVVGGNATAMAAAMGAEVTVFDHNRDKLAALRALGNNITGLYPYADAIDRAVREADLLIGAVLIPGAKAPHLVSAKQVAAMQPGSVIIDVAVDQGGCIETTHPTNWAEPTFVYEGVLHFGVTNMPGAVPRSASQALSAALIPYAAKLAAGEWNESLQAGVNVRAGEIVYPALRG